MIINGINSSTTINMSHFLAIGHESTMNHDHQQTNLNQLHNYLEKSTNYYTNSLWWQSHVFINHQRIIDHQLAPARWNCSSTLWQGNFEGGRALFLPVFAGAFASLSKCFGSLVGWLVTCIGWLVNVGYLWVDYATCGHATKLWLSFIRELMMYMLL